MSALRVLISAFSCIPGLGSEPGIGWGVVQKAASRHEVWVLTDERNRPYIDEYLDRHPLRGAHFEFVSLAPGLRWLASARSYGYIYYFIWQVVAFLAGRRLHRRIGFDLVHHATYANAWAPSWMGWLGIPFIWTTGTKDVTPWRFYATLGRLEKVSETMRTFAIEHMGTVTHYCTATRASLILSSSPESAWRKGLPVRHFPLGGLDPDDVGRLRTIESGPPGRLRIASIGRLLGFKGFGLGIEAFARLRRDVPDCEYWIIGDGPDRQRLEQLARALGCFDAVRFLGWVPRQSLPVLLGDVDVLLHPSLHEQFGYVLLEAMAAGRPVICLDRGGLARFIDGKGAICIPTSTPKQVVADIYGVLREMYANPEQRQRYGQAARKWAETRWTWDTVGEQLLQAYEEVARSGATRRVHKGFRRLLSSNTP